VVAIIVGTGQYIVDATRCDHTADPPICFCIHDGRIAGKVGEMDVTGKVPAYWGNVAKTGDATSDGG
jgi:hypothetical protein